MPHMNMSLWAHKRIKDLDEKLRWGLISPRKYDQICERIMLRDQREKDERARRWFSAKRSHQFQKLKALRRERKISEEEYRLRLKSFKAKKRKGTKRRSRHITVSDPSLSSSLGKQPLFPPGRRSPRIRGRTGYLAKKYS